MKDEVFHKLTEEQLLQGMNLCLENCNNHFRSAEALEKIELYGIANSHLILSSEEGIKTILFLAKIIGLDLGFVRIEPMFKTHTSKHNAARELYWNLRHNEKILELVKEELEKHIKDFIVEKNGEKVLDEDKFHKEYLRLSAMKTRQLQLSHLKGNWTEEEKEIKWWGKADQNKNKGFYINFYNNKWESPMQITKEVFDESKIIVTNMISAVNRYCDSAIHDLEIAKKSIKYMEDQKIELFNTTPNGIKIDRIVLTEVTNIDGSDTDYKIEYINFLDNKVELVGTCDLILGNIQFEETRGIGIPHSAIKLLIDWIEENKEK